MSIMNSAISLLFATFLLVPGNTQALVGEGATQKIVVNRDANRTLQFIVQGSRSFTDLETCAKFVYQRCSLNKPTEKGVWANAVDILFLTPMSAKDRQYVGDRFVANKVYPDKVTHFENGGAIQRSYKPGKDDFSSKRRKLE